MSLRLEINSKITSTQQRNIRTIFKRLLEFDIKCGYFWSLVICDHWSCKQKFSSSCCVLDLFEVFPRDQILVLPFDYFTTEQFEATNKILEFLNITQITDPKKILKVSIASEQLSISNGPIGLVAPSLYLWNENKNSESVL